MNIKNKLIMLLTLLVVSSVSFAQPGTVVGSATTNPGGTVSIPVNFLGTGGGTLAGSVEVVYDPAVVTVNSVACEASLPAAMAQTSVLTCTNDVMNSLIFILMDPSGTAQEIQDGLMATITFDINAMAAAPSTTNLSLANENYGAGGPPIAPVGSVPGVITIAAISPQYTSVPFAPGDTIALGQILQGGTNPTSSIDITNSGDPGTTLMGTCTAAAPFIVTGGAYSVAQGAAAVTVGVACDATAAPMVYNGTLSCTQNGSNIVGTADYPLTCEVLAAAATGDQNPANGTALSVVVAPGGSATTSVTFSEVGGQGVDITDLTCTVTPGVGFAITSPGAFPATVPAAGTLPVVVTFTDPGDGSATAGSLDCTYTDGTGAVAVSYPLTFAIRAINVPALSMMGYIALTLGFGLIGFFAFRRRA